MAAPIVSIVMNCYNSSEFLKEALESVLVQSFQDWELIFWDNQSTDCSSEIYNSFGDTRFKYYRAERHTSLGEARNLAASKATGNWLAFIDCDDKWYVDKLEVQLSQINEKTSDVGLLYGIVTVQVGEAQAGSDVARYYDRLQIHPHDAENIFNRLLQGNFIIFSSAMVLRELFFKVGGIDAALRQNEDYDLLLKISLISRAICVNGLCVVYRIHSANNSHAQAELAYQENIRIFGSLPQGDSVVEAIALNNSRYAIYKIANGNIFSGLSLLLTRGSVTWVFRRTYFKVKRKLLSYFVR